MNTHIDKLDILKYVTGLLPSEDRAAIEKHIASCPTCLMKVSHGYAKNKEAHEKANGLIDKLSERKLEQDETTLLTDHRKICNDCEQKYHELLEKKELESVESVWSNIKTFNVSVYRLPLRRLKQSGGEDNEEKRLEIKRKDMKIALIHDQEGNLKVHLKSDKYDVSGAEVSIGRKVEDGFQPLVSATAAEEGVANLGLMNTIKEHRAKGSLALSIDGRKKKRNQD